MLFKNSLHGSACPPSDGDCLHSFLVVSVSNKHHTAAPCRIGCSVILAWWMRGKNLGFEPLASCKCFFHNTVRWAAQLEGDKWGSGTVSSSILEAFCLIKVQKREGSSSWTLFSHYYGDQELSVLYYWIQNLENKLGPFGILMEKRRAFIFKFWRCFGRHSYCHVVSITLVIHSFWERWWGCVGRLHRSTIQQMCGIGPKK